MLKANRSQVLRAALAVSAVLATAPAMVAAQSTQSTQSTQTGQSGSSGGPQNAAGAMQVPRTSTGLAPPQGAVDQGRQLASQGLPDKGVAACASCHGQQGEGMAASGFPRLAGQPGAYLAHQIESFANGSRNNPIMTPIAKSLTQEQNVAVAAYYSSLLANAGSNGGTRVGSQQASSDGAAPATGQTQPTSQNAQEGNRKPSDRGRRLASVGDDSAQVQACANCHGPVGAGEGPAYPYLAGQHASYLTSALGEWKNGGRNTDPSGQMQGIAKRLNDDDIAALAAYYAGQPFPVPRVPVTAPVATARNSAPGRGGPTGERTEGVGTEQGAPLTGGAQGIGGGGATQGANPTQGGPRQ